jgi:hypothetical protein
MFEEWTSGDIYNRKGSHAKPSQPPHSRSSILRPKSHYRKSLTEDDHGCNSRSISIGVNDGLGVLKIFDRDSSALFRSLANSLCSSLFFRVEYEPAHTLGDSWIDDDVI